MTEHDGGFDLHLSRRKLLAAAGLLGGAAVAGPFAETAAAEAAAGSPNPAKTPPVAGLHLQFGADASSQMVVSWHSLQPVLRPRVLLGRMDGRLEQVAPADTVSYADAKSGQVVHAHHARIGGLRPDAAYLYGALHDGAAPRFSAFRTAPRGRAPFTFTSFGDQGTPTLGRLYDPPAGVTLPAPLWVNDNLGTPSAADTMLGVERLQPLFHLFNGDLCYANLAHDRVRAWWDFWENNSRSAANRPWMPSAGNHENELGNGPIGYRAYQTYFSVPEAAGQTELTRGLWYAFTAGSVRVVSIAMTTSAIRTAATLTSAAIRRAPRRPGWKPSWRLPAATPRSTGSWSACTRSPSRRPTSPTAPTSASARNGRRCSTSTASTWWSAATNITMSARIPSAASKPTQP
jgi:hypothetical protein